MRIPPTLFPVCFIAIWIFVSFVLSRMGWVHLARKYGSQPLSDGKGLGWLSMRVNWIHYRNCVVVYYNASGLYLRPLLLFRLFHQPVCIPWEQFSHSETLTFWGKSTNQLYLSAPSELIIPLSDSQWKTLERYLKPGSVNVD